MANAGWTLGAVCGGLVAGLGITAMMMKEERDTGMASELTVLARDSAHRLGLEAPRGCAPGPAEQAVVQGGHLALSALAGATYAASFEEDAAVVSSGTVFGLAFYFLAHVVAGPALGVKAPEWRQPRGIPLRHAMIHTGFGLITALGARLGARTCRRI